MAYSGSHVADLRDWIPQHSEKSFDIVHGGMSMEKAYIPKDAVEQRFQTPKDNYRWTTSLLNKVFQDRLPVSARDVSNRCCRVMCILISIGRPELITSFVSIDRLWDKNLPFDAKVAPAAFPEPNDPSLYERFIQCQWRYCAAQMESMNDWQPGDDRILPFTRGELIKDTDSSVVYEVHVHEKHDMLVEHSSPARARSHRYALKQYKGRDAERNFHRETAAFMNVTGAGSKAIPGIIGFYLSFRYRGTFNVLLEFAEEGTLEQFFAYKANPSTGEDIYDFWSNLLETVKGISLLHKQQLFSDERPSSSVTSLQGWHQDLKPENILVCKDHACTGYQQWKFKVADLALAHFRVVSERGEAAQDFNTFGIETYAPPECLGQSNFNQFHPNLVTNAVDIWALGCIFTEACAWVVKGIAGLRELRRLRKEATDAILDFRGGDCFHNGEDVLPIIRDQLRLFRRNVLTEDVTTGRIIDVLIRAMFNATASDRPSARHLQSRVEEVLSDAKSDLFDAEKVSVPTDEDNPRPFAGPSQTSDHDVVPPTALGASTFVHSPDSATPRAQSRGELRDQHTATQQRDLVADVTRKLSNDEAATNMNADTGRHRSETTQSSLYTPPHPSTPTAAGSRSIRPRADTRDTQSRYAAGDTDLEFSPRSENSSSKLPRLSVSQAWEWFVNEKDKGTHSTQLPNKKYLTELQDRDQVFIVDDSESMRAHRPDMSKLLRILAYMTKPYDPDKKLELYFLGSDERCKSRRSSKLFDAVESRPAAGETDLKRLGEILRKYGRDVDDYARMRSNILISRFAKAPKQKSIYIFTDGKLEKGNHNEGHYDIRTIVRKLENADLDHEQIGIQFISFGSDQDALRRLETLDRFCSQESEALPFDIVDTEPSDGNVLKMLLGAFKPKFDDDGPPRTTASPTTGATTQYQRHSMASH